MMVPLPLRVAVDEERAKPELLEMSKVAPLAMEMPEVLGSDAVLASERVPPVMVVAPV